MKEEILKLREEGKTYNEIIAIIGCSKGTVAYHCGDGVKDKTYKRTIKKRAGQDAIDRKLENFLYTKAKRFKYNSRYGGYVQGDFNIREVANNLKEKPICYLTGRTIDLNDKKSYSLDHITPSSKGGTNNLDNLGLSCRDANMSKTDMSLEEYLKLCKEVLEHNGYCVTKHTNNSVSI